MAVVAVRAVVAAVIITAVIPSSDGCGRCVRRSLSNSHFCCSHCGRCGRRGHRSRRDRQGHHDR